MACETKIDNEVHEKLFLRTMLDLLGSKLSFISHGYDSAEFKRERKQSNLATKSKIQVLSEIVVDSMTC